MSMITADELVVAAKAMLLDLQELTDGNPAEMLSVLTYAIGHMVSASPDRAATKRILIENIDGICEAVDADPRTKIVFAHSKLS